jgi:hypothetical protein
MKFTQRRSNAHGKPQKITYFHRRAEQPREWLTARIIQHKRAAGAFVHQFPRPHCPRAIKFILQAKLVVESVKASWQRMFGSRAREQYAMVAVLEWLVSPIEDSLAIIPQYVQCAIHRRLALSGQVFATRYR